MKWIVEHHSDSCPWVPCCQNEDVTLGLHLKLLLQAAPLIADLNTHTTVKSVMSRHPHSVYMRVILIKLTRIRAVISEKQHPGGDFMPWFVMHYTSARFCFCHVADVTQCLCFWVAFLELLAMTQQSHDSRRGPVCKGIRNFSLYSRFSSELMTLNATGASCSMSHDAFDFMEF